MHKRKETTKNYFAYKFNFPLSFLPHGAQNIHLQAWFDFHSLSLHFNIHLYLPLSFLSFFLLRRFFLFFIFSSFSCMFVFMPLFYSLKRGLRSLSPNIYSCQGRILISFILLLYTWYIPMHLLKECVSSKNEKTLVFYF